MDIIKRDPFRDLMHWDPFRDLDLSRAFAWPRWGEGVGLEGWTPAVDILEDDKAVTIKVDLPGVEKKDLEISVSDGTLTVHGERKLEREEKKEDYQRRERAHGSFTRSFSLPDYVDARKIAAESKEGVLCITLPKTKAAKAEAKKIPVK